MSPLFEHDKNLSSCKLGDWEYYVDLDSDSDIVTPNFHCMVGKGDCDHCSCIIQMVQTMMILTGAANH